MANTRSPVGGARRRRRWQEAFLAELANTSNVTGAAERAGVTTSTVYDLRRRDENFSREWQLALCEGYDNLEMEVLHRLRAGEVKAAVEKGSEKNAGTLRAFDNAAAMRLLSAHRESAARARAVRASVTAGEVRASIDRKLAQLRDKVLTRRAAETRGETRGRDA